MPSISSTGFPHSLTTERLAAHSLLQQTTPQGAVCVTIFHTTFYEQADHRMLQFFKGQAVAYTPVGVRDATEGLEFTLGLLLLRERSLESISVCNCSGMHRRGNANPNRMCVPVL